MFSINHIVQCLPGVTVTIDRSGQTRLKAFENQLGLAPNLLTSGNQVYS